jgi:uncharacterized caspase-like protein
MTTRRTALLGFSALSLGPLIPARVFADASINTRHRMALLLGNAAYKPKLRNPANDVAALKAVLTGAGFQVATHVDGKKGSMEAAIAEYCRSLEREQGVGVFYYAGHAVQLGWRNYLVPVDAALRSADEIPAATVELSSVLEGLRRAANPMNVVIVDACRDNPFGSELKTTRGLSQMDAPSRTLLAYSTSPGNTADDGEGDNGLYTSHLLREMRTPEAKIEDVFKRVRLGVRRASSGGQIPWESTSLEDDFYFLPPASLAKPSSSEADKRYAEDLQHWQAAEASSSIESLGAYLQRHPSGHFAELAQVRLDVLLARRGEKRVVPVSAPDNPFTQGSVIADRNYSVGDRYRYLVTNTQTGLAGADRMNRVTSLTDFEVIYNNGGNVTDRLGNQIKRADGTRLVDAQAFASEYALGRKWQTRLNITYANGQSDDLHMDLAVVGRDEIEVKAGRFRAFRVVGSGWGSSGTRHELAYWIAPDQVRRALRRDGRVLDRGGRPQHAERVELAGYHEAIAPRGA